MNIPERQSGRRMLMGFTVLLTPRMTLEKFCPLSVNSMQPYSDPFSPFHGFGQSFTDVENEGALKLLLLEAGGTTKVIETALR